MTVTLEDFLAHHPVDRTVEFVRGDARIRVA